MRCRPRSHRRRCFRPLVAIMAAYDIDAYDAAVGLNALNNSNDAARAMAQRVSGVGPTGNFVSRCPNAERNSRRTSADAAAAHRRCLRPTASQPRLVVSGPATTSMPGDRPKRRNRYIKMPRCHRRPKRCNRKTRPFCNSNITRHNGNVPKCDGNTKRPNSPPVSSRAACRAAGSHGHH